MAKLLSGTRIYGTATVDTNLFVNSTDNSTSPTTGALQVVGGAGIGGSLYVGGNTVFSTDLAVNGGNLTTTATTFNLINTTATTVNFAGAATNLTISADTGTTTVRNNLTINSTLDVNGQTTLASVNVEDLTSGRIVFAGLNGELVDSANLTFVNNKLTVTGDLDVTGNLSLGNQATNDISVTANFTSDLIPKNSITYDLGKTDKRWKEVYASKFVGEIYGGTY
jgi:hypothetical protein